MNACLADMSGDVIHLPPLLAQTTFCMNLAQPPDCLMYYTPFYIYSYKPFMLMHLLLVSLNTNNVIINISFRLLIKCIVILMLRYRLIGMYYK